MSLSTLCCPVCGNETLEEQRKYKVQAGETRRIFRCPHCGNCFSETKNTFLERLRTPLSKIAQVLHALNDGMGINAVCRTFKVAKNTVYDWLERLAGLKETLLLYALCHQFLSQLIEGDELYTKVYENTSPEASEGWTIVLMERASRFIWELSCGERTETLFAQAIALLAQVVKQTDDLSLLTDGERRYGNCLFAICQDVIRTGKPGRPRKTLRKGVKVRVKNKGTQAHKKGPKRPKYQAPHKEHPDTLQNLELRQIHANHLEAFHSALRRILACYRRRTNTYAKQSKALQRRLDAYWVLHNFVREHFTTKQVPAVALGILDQALSYAVLARIQVARPLAA